MNLTAKTAINAFINSNFCFDGEAANTLINMMGGDERFALIASKLVQDNYEMDMTWALINTNTQGFNSYSRHAISVIAEGDTDNLKGPLINALAVSNSRTGLNFTLPELTAFLLNDDNQEQTKYGLYWNMLNEYGIKRICTDFCLYCEKNNFIIELVTPTQAAA